MTINKTVPGVGLIDPRTVGALTLLDELIVALYLNHVLYKKDPSRIRIPFLCKNMEDLVRKRSVAAGKWLAKPPAGQEVVISGSKSGTFGDSL